MAKSPKTGKANKDKSTAKTPTTLANEDDLPSQGESCLVSTLKLLAIMLIVISAFIYMNPTNVSPSPWTLPPPPDITVSYALNYAESIFRSKRTLKGPESIAVSPKSGYLYSGTQDGKIVKGHLSKPYSAAPEAVGVIGDPNAALPLPCGTYTTEPICGRPLGMELHSLMLNNPNGQPRQQPTEEQIMYDIAGEDVVFIADAYFGIYQYVPKYSSLQPLLVLDNEEGGIHFVNQPKLVLRRGMDISFNDVAFNKYEHKLYFTVMSHKFKLNDLLYELLDNSENGLLCAYDLRTQETELVMPGLAFPNGVVFNPITKQLYVSELGRNRILQVNLNHPTPPSIANAALDLNHLRYRHFSVLIDNLPLNPDNLALIYDRKAFLRDEYQYLTQKGGDVSSYDPAGFLSNHTVELWVAGVNLRYGKVTGFKNYENKNDGDKKNNSPQPPTVEGPNSPLAAYMPSASKLLGMFTHKSLLELLLPYPALRKMIAKAVPKQFASAFTKHSLGGVVRIALPNPTISPRAPQQPNQPKPYAHIVEVMLSGTNHKNANVAGLSHSVASITPHYFDENLPEHQIYVFFGGYSPDVSSVGRMIWDLKNQRPVESHSESLRKELRLKYRQEQEEKEVGVV